MFLSHKSNTENWKYLFWNNELWAPLILPPAISEGVFELGRKLTLSKANLLFLAYVIRRTPPSQEFSVNTFCVTLV